MEGAMRISVIVPALNEAAGIGETLRALRGMRARGHEVVVVDGGSEDGTVDIAAPMADRVLVAPRGRARQQNAGADAASGDVLLFLHADTRLPPDADRAVLEGLARSGRGWGRFDLRLSGERRVFRFLEWTINLRSRLSGIATGDQAIFATRERFLRAGGFPDIPLMEDVALSAALRRGGRPLCLRQRAVTSSRRWGARGVLRTVALMWRLRLEFALGADPARLAERYR
jgi:rSAM/selenodomain-associated transferase 2